jgi:molybdopterin adenylyltransferase
MMRIVSVNVSKAKGTIKEPVDNIKLCETGVSGDAHAGIWHRQVSLLGRESFEKFSQLAGRMPAWGEFAENITTEGLVLYDCRPFDQLRIGEVLLEVTQIGKSCHGDSCAIFREVGSCVMPKEGIFCRVLNGGTVSPGDTFTYYPKAMKVLVVTLSDRASSGEYTDRSGPVVAERVSAVLDRERWPVEMTRKVIPDKSDMLKQLICEQAAKHDIVITTGGTGLGPRDITVDTLLPMFDKEIPGIMDMIRVKYGAKNPHALLSRSVAGMIGKTLLFVLPGSVKAVNEYMEEIGTVLNHLIYMVHGIDKH